MPSGTTYKPTSTSQFEAAKLNFNAQGVSASVAACTTQNVDYTLSDDCLITGAWLLIDGGNIGDSANFQIVDTSGAFTGVAGTVLNQFITNWYFPATVDTQFDMIYPAKIYAGLTLRLAYTSTGSNSPFVAINYKLHKVLI